MLKHYIKFGYPGIFLSDESVMEIKNRDISNISMPKTAFGYQFFDIEEIEINGEILSGKKKNITGWHYYGRKLSKDDVRREMGRCVLLENMECNHWDYVVKTRFGNVYNLNSNDVVLA